MTRSLTAALGLALAICTTAGVAAAQEPASPDPTASAVNPPPSRPRQDRSADGEDASLDLMSLLGGGRLKGDALKASIATASAFPLGGKENPVRVSMPQGQHAYLRRLRCSNDRAPRFERVGSFGSGVFGSIIDGYKVVCLGKGEPKTSVIYMDMYHPDHDETAPPPGFSLKSAD